MKEKEPARRLNGDKQIDPFIILGNDADENLVCAIAHLPEDPEVMGIVLADAVRHIANAYCGEGDSAEKSMVVMGIVGIFNAEMSRPTAEAVILTKTGALGPGLLSVGEADGDAEVGED